MSPLTLSLAANAVLYVLGGIISAALQIQMSPKERRSVLVFAAIFWPLLTGFSLVACALGARARIPGPGAGS